MRIFVRYKPKFDRPYQIKQLILLIIVSLLWWPQCRDSGDKRLLLENQKLEQNLAKAEQEKKQLPDNLHKKNVDIDVLSSFVGDFLCDPLGSNSMLAFLQKHREHVIDFGLALERIHCGSSFKDVPRLMFYKGDKRPEIIKKVAPNPEWLRWARAEGVVILEVGIDTEGNVRCPCVIRGHPLFNGYAWEAVIQWKYRPYLINGKPSPVRFLVEVDFKLYSGSKSEFR